MKSYIIFSFSFFSVILAVYILSIGRTFFIPLAIAIIIGYLLIALAEWFTQKTLFKWHIPRSLGYLGALASLLFALWIIFSLIGKNFALLIETAPIYQERLQQLTINIYDKFGTPPPPRFCQPS